MLRYFPSLCDSREHYNTPDFLTISGQSQASSGSGKLQSPRRQQQRRESFHQVDGTAFFWIIFWKANAAADDDKKPAMSEGTCVAWFIERLDMKGSKVLGKDQSWWWSRLRFIHCFLFPANDTKHPEKTKPLATWLLPGGCDLGQVACFLPWSPGPHPPRIL